MHSFVYLSSCYLFAQKKSILSCDAKRKCFFQVFDSCLEEASPPINTNRLPHKNLIQFCSTKSQQKSSQGGSYCKVRTIIQKTTTVRRSPWASTWWQGQEKKLLTGRNLFQNKGRGGAPSVVIGWVVRGMESFKAEFVHPCLLSCSWEPGHVSIIGWRSLCRIVDKSCGLCLAITGSPSQ